MQCECESSAVSSPSVGRCRLSCVTQRTNVTAHNGAAHGRRFAAHSGAACGRLSIRMFDYVRFAAHSGAACGRLSVPIRARLCPGGLNQAGVAARLSTLISARGGWFGPCLFHAKACAGGRRALQPACSAASLLPGAFASLRALTTSCRELGSVSLHALWLTWACAAAWQAALVRHCGSDATLLQSFESYLFPPFQVILQACRTPAPIRPRSGPNPCACPAPLEQVWRNRILISGPQNHPIAPTSLQPSSPRAAAGWRVLGRVLGFRALDLYKLLPGTSPARARRFH